MRPRVGCETSLPANSASPCLNATARSSSPRGAWKKPPRCIQVCERVHPHQRQVVALRDDVLVHFLRALGDDEQVEAVLAALAGDSYRVFGGELEQRALRDLRADVVRLVQNDKHGLALGTRSQRCPSTAAAVRCCSSPRRQRAEVHDEAARPRRSQLVEQGDPVPGGPHLPAVDTEVLDPPAEDGGPHVRGVRRRASVVGGGSPVCVCSRS